MAGAVPPGDAAAAVARGAYDVIDAREPGAVARLAQRIAELATVEPPVPGDGSVRGRQRCGAVGAARGGAGRADVDAGAADRRDRHGQGGRGAPAARMVVAAHAPLHPDQLRRDPERAASKPSCSATRKGAFTGSVRAYEGQLTAAEGGTVFLDEVDDTPLPFQVKLLRVLEDRVVSRIGENASHVVDFRILAATNRDLRPLCADGRVRRRPLRAPGDRVDPDAAAARADRGPAGAGDATSRGGSTARSRTRRRGTRSRARRRPRWRRCARTRGRATSASCAT